MEINSKYLDLLTFEMLPKMKRYLNDTALMEFSIHPSHKWIPVYACSLLGACSFQNRMISFNFHRNERSLE